MERDLSEEQNRIGPCIPDHGSYATMVTMVTSYLAHWGEWSPLKLGVAASQLGHQSVVLSLFPLNYNSHHSNLSLSGLQVCLKEF